MNPPSADRILERCEALARLSEHDDGLTRVYLSEEHRRANALVSEWMREAGMTARIDAIGNVCGRYEGSRPALPCLMLGSHLDTVRDAGKYDGMLGIVTAIECIGALSASERRLPHALEVIGFADEEGVRFGSTLLGSRAVAGTFDRAVLEKSDAGGMSMQEALQLFGLDPAAIPQAARRREDVLAFAELHIEQGPVLEAEGLPVGVVTAINGATRCAIEVSGIAGHAGTVPMHLRHDALAAASECVLAIERIANRAKEVVATVGKIEVRPGAVNVIPGSTRFTLDVRAPDDGVRSAIMAEIEGILHAVCARRSVRIRIERTHENRTAPCAPWLVDQIGAAIAGEGIPVRRLPSGAGHDAMAMIDLTGVGMLFVRCARGISHHPAEAVQPEDVAIAARVFLRFIERFRPHVR
jgi:allantoate deiminase